MATKQIGKLKLHCSKRGVAFKWGDGEIHRLSFERKNSANASAGDDGYDAPGYGQDYDPNYNPQNADYYEGDQPAGQHDVLYHNDFLMYALLVLLPPLGIWILWKRERFTQPVRIAVSAASAIWFIVLLIWLFSAILGGGSDTVTPAPNMNPAVVATPLPVQTNTNAGNVDITAPAPVSTPVVGDGNVSVLDNTGSAEPSGTNSGTSGTSGTDSAGTTYVYATNTGTYYHKDSACPNIEEGATQVSVNIALSRGQAACPTCYPNSTGTTYYVTSNGKYYHKSTSCSRLKGKTTQATTLAAAKKAGKTVCPTCIGEYYATKTGKYYHKKNNCSGMSNAQHITKAAAKKAGKTACPVCIGGASSSKSASGGKSTTPSAAKKYYSTRYGKYYHSNKTCGGMKGATQITAAIAKKRNQTACPVCIGKSAGSSSSSSAKTYYATKVGKYYHINSTCSGMKNATKVTLAAAKKAGKTACPVCLKSSSSATTSKQTVFFAVKGGKYYHRTTACTRLKNVKSAEIKKVTKATASKNGMTACPTCLAAKASETYVYSALGGKYYHRLSTCSGMKNARKITLAGAKKRGQTACPVCYKSQAAKGAVYYTTKLGKYYHANSTCSGMKNATKVTLASARAQGKTACPVCLRTSSGVAYYVSKANKYYHVKKDCSGMVGATKMTLAAAKNAGKTACPVCIKGKTTPAPTPKVYCYASSGSKYYHKNANCTGLKNAKKVLLSRAKAKGKSACPICVTKKIKQGNLTTGYADKKTVAYASGASAYYHSNKGCVSGLKKTTVYLAKKKGKVACPTCAGGLNTYVYVTRNGTRYHRKSTCDGMVSAYKVSLATAVRLNYTRCPKCNPPKASKVK